MDDDKIKVLRAEHKNDGFTFLILLWCSLYKNDYFKKWSSREKKLFCSDNGFNLDDADNFIDTCLAEGLFDANMYDKYEILTGKTIQEIWIDITTRRKKLTLIKEYLMIDIGDIPNNKRVELVDLDNKIISPAKFDQQQRRKPEKEKDSAPPSNIPNIKENSYQDIMAFISIPYDDRDDVFKTTYSKEEYNDFTKINNIINDRYSGIRKSTRQLSFYDYGEFISSVVPTPTLVEIEQAFKKMATLGVNQNTDIFLRLGDCLDMIRKPFIKPPIQTPALNGSYLRDAPLEKDVMGFWGFNEISNPEKLILLVQFITVMNNTGRLTEFRSQFKDYMEFKTLNGLAFKHNFDNFIGKQSEKFEDGKWLSENWKQKLIEEKNKQAKKSQNGRSNRQRSGHTPNDYGDV